MIWFYLFVFSSFRAFVIGFLGKQIQITKTRKDESAKKSQTTTRSMIWFYLFVFSPFRAFVIAFLS